MHARFPKIDFSAVRLDWAPVREFAQTVNASSTIPPFVEPWLIKVMMRARDLLPASEVALREDVNAFIAQEAQHYRQHQAFNRRLYEAYPAIEPELRRIESEYDAMLATRSLKFCMAYAEGFESMGAPAAMLWFDRYRPYLEGADYEAVALWKWHMAEEFEHREVCFRIYKAIYARGIWNRFWNGWLYRCYGFVCTLVHLGSYSKRVARLLIDADRVGMNSAERRPSVDRERKFGKFMRDNALPQLLKVFSPFYNPAHKREPEGLSAYLARFEKGG